MHCPHKSPHFLSIQETVSCSLAPDILQVSVCLWDCSANQNMFIKENKRKNVTLSACHLLSEGESLDWFMFCDEGSVRQWKQMIHKLSNHKTVAKWSHIKCRQSSIQTYFSPTHKVSMSLQLAFIPFFPAAFSTQQTLCFFLFFLPHLYVFPARLSLMLLVAKNILGVIKWNGALSINSTPAFCKQSAPGIAVCFYGKAINDMFKTERQNPQ